jgi:hypothetical protein
MFDLQHHPFFQTVISCQYDVQGGLPVVTTDFGEKPEVTHIYTEQGYVFGGCQMTGTQNGAISPQSDYHVKIITLNMALDYLVVD